MPLKQQVVGQLQRLIAEGGLQPGDQLPGERELCEQLQVSRGTVREAVRFLEALGLVVIRHGSGTFVRASSHDRGGLRSEWQRWTQRHAGRIHELLEARKGIESFAAELAAQRRLPQGVKAMAQALEQMAWAEAASDVPGLVESDLLFHRGLCMAAGNRALAGPAQRLGKQLLRERAATWDLAGRPRRSLEQHRRILEAVRAGRPAEARTAVLEHLESVELDVERHLAAAPGRKRSGGGFQRPGGNEARPEPEESRRWTP